MASKFLSEMNIDEISKRKADIIAAATGKRANKSTASGPATAAAVSSALQQMLSAVPSPAKSTAPVAQLATASPPNFASTVATVAGAGAQPVVAVGPPEPATALDVLSEEEEAELEQLGQTQARMVCNILLRTRMAEGCIYTKHKVLTEHSLVLTQLVCKEHYMSTAPQDRRNHGQGAPHILLLLTLLQALEMLLPNAPMATTDPFVAACWVQLKAFRTLLATMDLTLQGEHLRYILCKQTWQVQRQPSYHLIIFRTEHAVKVGS